MIAQVNHRGPILIFLALTFKRFGVFFYAIERSAVLKGKNDEDQWNSFSQLLLDACAKCILYNKPCTINRPEWLNGMVKNSLNKSIKHRDVHCRL